MKLILCVDDMGGILFNKRRQSSDREVVARIRQLRGDQPLWMSSYSKKLFKDDEDVVVTDRFERVGADDFYFFEVGDLQSALRSAQMLIIYRWNRVYPADVKFPGGLPPIGWKRISAIDFGGYSHEKITQEVYSREDE